MGIILTNLELAEFMCKRNIVPERRILFRDIRVPPHYAASAARNWAWLVWQRSKSAPIVRDEMNTILRSMALTPTRLAEADQEGYRGQMDWFSLVCAVISSDESLMQFAAESAVFAKASKGQSGFFQIMSGILKARILGDHKKELSQCRLLDTQRPEEPDIGPSISLVRSFVNREYGEFGREVTKGVKRHWSNRFLGTKSDRRPVKSQRESNLTLDIGQKPQVALWAHCEAVFGKLAIMDGAAITSDDIWFPLDFISAPILKG